MQWWWSRSRGVGRGWWYCDADYQFRGEEHDLKQEGTGDVDRQWWEEMATQMKVMAVEKQEEEMAFCEKNEGQGNKRREEEVGSK